MEFLNGLWLLVVQVAALCYLYWVMLAVVFIVASVVARLNPLGGRLNACLAGVATVSLFMLLLAALYKVFS